MLPPLVLGELAGEVQMEAEHGALLALTILLLLLPTSEAVQPVLDEAEPRGHDLRSARRVTRYLLWTMSAGAVDHRGQTSPVQHSAAAASVLAAVTCIGIINMLDKEIV